MRNIIPLIGAEPYRIGGRAVKLTRQKMTPLKPDFLEQLVDFDIDDDLE